MCGTWSFTKLALWFIQQQICIKCHVLDIVPGTGITEMGTRQLLTQKRLAQVQTPNKWCSQWRAKCRSRLHEGLRSADGEHLLCHWGSERAGWPNWETSGTNRCLTGGIRQTLIQEMLPAALQSRCYYPHSNPRQVSLSSFYGEEMGSLKRQMICPLKLE